MLCIAHDPGVWLRDIAATVGITEGSAYGVVSDLTTAGYAVRQKDGHRNRYQIQARLPLCPPHTDGGRGRAEARSFADVYDLAHRCGRDQLLDWAADDDPGFDNQIFADMLASIEPLSDEDLPVQARRASELRAYFRDWAAELAAH